jgi:hypothetical protein
MYQYQRGSLAAALKAAGLPERASVLIANILGNPNQTLKSGPIEQDTTPRNMRAVNRTDRMTLPSLDFKEGDPYYVPPRTPDSEEKPVPRQRATVTEPVAPQQTDAKFDLGDGAFTDTVSSGDNVVVNLRLSGPTDGMVVANVPGNTLVSRPFRASSNANGLRFFIEANTQEIVWRLAFSTDDAAFVDVVTDVRLEGNNIVLSKARLYPLKFEPLADAVAIPVVECP